MTVKCVSQSGTGGKSQSPPGALKANSAKAKPKAQEKAVRPKKGKPAKKVARQPEPESDEEEEQSEGAPIFD